MREQAGVSFGDSLPASEGFLRWPKDVPEQPATFWDDINLDLRDAVLVDLDLDECRVGYADFYNARLHGFTSCRKATFATAVFMNASFSGRAEFTESTITKFANFTDATFVDGALFDRATFAAAAFTSTTFAGYAIFNEASFTDFAYFSDATIAGSATFWVATFAGTAKFNHVTFADDADFAGAIFAGETSFEGATFTGQAWFGGAINLRGAGVDPHTASQSGHFVVLLSSNVDHVPAARFDGTLSMEGACVTEPQRHHSWPPAWRPKPNRDDPAGPHLLLPRKLRKNTEAP
jgi:uncharacterized protein YjbI with pentapeptide repeats